MHSEPTTIAAHHFADEGAKAPENEIDKAYFHLVKAEEPWPIGETEQPPANAKVWTAEDWFDMPPERMFTNYVGDCQPRHADGQILQTAERMAIEAACARSGSTANDAWTGVPGESDADVIWIASRNGAGAMPTAAVEEDAQHRAMRDLPGKDGYGRARGTEDIERPSQAARVRALALHVGEVARASGIELRRETGASAPRDHLPRMACYADGGSRVTLGPGFHERPSTPDLIEETTAVAIARAHARGDEHPQRWQRAVIAGVIAGHHLAQTAGVRTLAPTHEDTVAAWRDKQKERGPEAAREERIAVVQLVRGTEWDLALPRSERQFRQWDRRTQARGDERPTPVGDAGRRTATEVLGGADAPMPAREPGRRPAPAGGGPEHRTER